MTDEIMELDRVLGFTIPARHARGRVVRLGAVLDQVLAAHSYPPAIQAILSEAMVLAALFGSTIKDDAGQMTLQAQTEAGVIDLMVCDYKAGVLRGYVKFDADRLAEMPVNPSLFALFGKGYLAITFDQITSGERYQGIVPLEGGSLAEAAESYFCQSEQIPSIVRIAHGTRENGGCVAGGMLIQHLPEGEEGRERLHARTEHPEWEHVRMLAQTIKPDELTDTRLSFETLIWHLFNEESEVRVLNSIDLRWGCRCDPVHFASVLSKFPIEERRDMADDDGFIRVDCAFCGTVYPIAVDNVTA